MLVAMACGWLGNSGGKNPLSRLVFVIIARSICNTTRVRYRITAFTYCTTEPTTAARVRRNGDSAKALQAKDEAVRNRVLQNQSVPRASASCTRSPAIGPATSEVVVIRSSDSANSALPIGQTWKFQALQQTSITPECFRQGFHALRADFEIPFGSSAPLRRWISQTRSNEALLFETIQRGIECAGRRLAPRASAYLAPDGDTVRVIVEAENRQENDLLKFAKL